VASDALGWVRGLPFADVGDRDRTAGPPTSDCSPSTSTALADAALAVDSERLG